MDHQIMCDRHDIFVYKQFAKTHIHASVGCANCLRFENQIINTQMPFFYNSIFLDSFLELKKKHIDLIIRLNMD